MLNFEWVDTQNGETFRRLNADGDGIREDVSF